MSLLTKKGELILIKKCKNFDINKVNRSVNSFLKKTLKETVKNFNSGNVQKGGVPYCGGNLTQCAYINPYSSVSCSADGTSAEDSSTLQKGGAVTMPSEFFGVNSNRYFEPGSDELKAHGNSFGAVTFDDNTMSPNLFPHMAGQSTDFQTGGAKNKKNKTKKTKGGAVVMPSEFFGVNSNRYFEPGSDELKAHGNSFGAITFDDNTMSPNLSPHLAGQSTDYQSGGANMFNKMKSIFNKKKFNENVKVMLKKIYKKDINMTEAALDKCRFLTEVYVMKKLC